MLWNDIEFHVNLMDTFDDEVTAFRWLFTPLPELNSRTPIEVLSSGGSNRVMQILEAQRL